MFQAIAAEAEAAIRVVLMPVDVVALVNTVLSGSAALISAFAAAYAIIAALRSKRAVNAVAEVKTDIAVVKTNVEKIEVATNSLVKKAEDAARREGDLDATKRAVATAATLAQGQEEGRANERESAAAKGSAPLVVPGGDTQVPVKDNRVATEIGKLTDAVEKSAAKKP